MIRGDLAVSLRIVPPRPESGRLLQEQEVELGVAAGREPLANAVRCNAQILVAFPTIAKVTERIEPLGERTQVELTRAVFPAVGDERPRLP